MMTESQSTNKTRVLWLALILFTVYESYRYPLQINASGTSSTYSDTPLALQAGKFLLACPLFALAGVQCFRKSAPLKRWLIAGCALFLGIFALLKSIGDPTGHYVESTFWMLLALVLAWSVDSVRISAIDRYLRFLLIYAVGSTLIEVVLFVTVGRLPALAWEGGLSIRFGGFLDDPNGFAAILFLLTGWSYVRFRGWRCFLIIAAITVMLLLTQSWTAIGFFVLVAFIWTLRAVSKRPLVTALTIGVFAFSILFIIHETALSPSELVQTFLANKRGSVAGHTFSLTEWGAKWSEWVMFGESTYTPFESWPARAIFNFGAAWSFVFFGITAAVIISMRRAFSSAGREIRPVYFGILLFGYYFVFGSLNLPFPAIFPINFMFFLFAFLVTFGKIHSDSCTAEWARNIPLLHPSVEGLQK
jgi:hypothetical protein